jgi:hypothetical protein
MEDLSELAKNSMWPTSQAAGNMVSDAKEAMTAPGSPPVDPLPPTADQGDPHVSVSGPDIKTGTDGKPKASSQDGPYKPGPPKWGPCTTPTVIRTT